jgi:hypothetical protein
MDGDGPCSLREDAVAQKMLELQEQVELLIDCYEQNPPEPPLPMALPPSEKSYDRAYVLTKLRLMCGLLTECRTIIKAPKI